MRHVLTVCRDRSLNIVCTSGYQEAFEAGMAPKVVLRATHQRALQVR